MTAASQPPWRTVGSEVVRANPWFTVRRDAVVRPDGTAGVYEHVVGPGAVTVLALDDGDRVALTRQWIYTHGGTQWRLPGGGIDTADADPMVAARRELAEETGLRAAHWSGIGRVHGADSMSNHVDHVFLATGLEQGAADLDPGEADLEVCWLPFTEAVGLVAAGQVPHAGSSYALLVTAVRRTCRAVPETRAGLPPSAR